MGKARGTTGSKGSKHALDKFYTKQEAADYFTSKISDISSYDLIIEPSAGAGVFLQSLSTLNINRDKVEAYDLEPESDTIIKADWFQVDKSTFVDKKTLVIGNPPFGKNGNLAMDFLKESTKFTDTIAFIIPRSFRKESVKNRVPANFWLIYEEDTPKNSFTLNNENYDVPCVFQIWERQDNKRAINKATATSDYIEFTTKDKADFRIQRVGGNAGKASLDLNRSTSSNYFIKNKSGITTENLVDIVNNIEFKARDYSTGPRSLSKGELMQELEKFIN